MSEAPVGIVDRIGTVAVDERTSSPFAGTLGARETLVVEGWALDEVHECAADGVVLTLGDASSVAEYGLLRPDVALAYANDSLMKCGFHGLIAPHPGSDGVQQLRVFVIGRHGDGLFTLGEAVDIKVIPATLPAFKPAPLRTGFASYCIDRGDGERVRRGETLSVTGWSYDRLALHPIRGVFLIVDDADVVYGAVGLSRPDVAASLGSDAYLQTGFVIHFNTWGLAPGLHRLHLGFIAHDGIAQESFALARGLEILAPASV